MAITTVAYDPFARSGITRESIPNAPTLCGPAWHCKWCGRAPRVMYAYNHDGAFCNLDCYRSYTY